MQTFLPYSGFAESAGALDLKRLGKQRVETIQVLRALTVPGYGWRHHPAAAMWAGYEEGLVRYGLDLCEIWCQQGRADTCATTLVVDLTAATGLVSCHRGWARRLFTSAIRQRWSARTRRTTGRCFRRCPTTCRRLAGIRPGATGPGGLAV